MLRVRLIVKSNLRNRVLSTQDSGLRTQHSGLSEIALTVIKNLCNLRNLRMSFPKTKTATRGRWVAVLATTTSKQAGSSPAVARGRPLRLAKHRDYHDTFVSALRQVTLGWNAGEFAFDGSLLF